MLGWPLDSTKYGGGWVYGMSDNRVSLGLVVGLEYKNPLFDPREAFQKFNMHPFVRRILEGGKLVRYGAKAIPEGGWYSMPRTYIDGGLIIGDAASFLNSQRLKGIHMAIKSGMLAAETIYETLATCDSSEKTLSTFPQKIESSWIKEELWEVRNFHQGFRHGLWADLPNAGLQLVSGGRGASTRFLLSSRKAFVFWRLNPSFRNVRSDKLRTRHHIAIAFHFEKPTDGKEAASKRQNTIVTTRTEWLKSACCQSIS